MVNPYKCGRCKTYYDSDLMLEDGGGAHHLPVSCTSCPYSICHVCFTDWLTDGRNDGNIPCPDCEMPDGFNAQRPSINRFACQLLEDQKKPAAPTAAKSNSTAVEAITAAAATPPPKRNKRKHSESKTKKAPPAPKKQKQNKTKKAPKKKKQSDADAQPLEVTEEELQALEEHDIVDGMDTWLEKVVKVSTSNKRNIMGKVKKLCAGEGLHLSTWNDDIMFVSGYPVRLSMDFGEMLEDAKKYEDKYGEDKGHGWGLRHPIKKLHEYQKYVLEQVLRV